MSITICLCVILLLVVFDQISKMLLMTKSIKIIEGLLYFVPRYNDGAAFSSLSGARVFFIIFTIIALLFMGYVLFFKKWSKHPLFMLALSVMIGGVVGNFIDRIVFGVVRDFIYIPPFGFVCNIADIAITVACVLFFIYIFFIRDKEEKRELQVKNDKDLKDQEKEE